jgi:hypothetical protein
MMKTFIAIVALLGVFATNVVAAPMSGFVPKTATAAVTKAAGNCSTTCMDDQGPRHPRTCRTTCY